MFGHATQYSYDATGVKRKVVHKTVKNNLYIGVGTTTYSPSLVDIQSTLTTDYCAGGHIVYENNALKRILNPEGYVAKQSNGTNKYFYYAKDHLGTNRAVFAATSTTFGGPEQETNYYPFGMPFTIKYSPRDGINPALQPYKFGDKEYDEMHGLNWSDFGARHYSGIIPVFMTMDPLCEKYYSVSPYAYCLNNPVNMIDPDGMDVYMLFYTNNDARFKSAAETRQREIESMKGFDKTKDHVYIQELGDLGTLGDRVDAIVKDATDNGYGLTVETSFWSHSGTEHGPRSDVATSGDNATTDGGKNQLLGEGWSKINWNFDTNNSLAAFYGCNSAGFAKKFLDYSNVAFTAGQGGSAGPSYTTNEFNNVSKWSRLFGTSKNVYYGTNADGSFYGPSVYSRRLGVENDFLIKGNASIIKGKVQRVVP